MKCAARGLWLLFWLCGVAILCPAHAGAQERPRVILILCDALTLDDFRNDSLPNLARLAETGAIGRMTCAVPAPRTPASGVLTLALGEQTAAQPTDEQAANDDETIPGERGTAREVYFRRVGPLVVLPKEGEDSAHSTIRHLGIASLVRRGWDRFGVGPILSQLRSPVRMVLVGNADAGAMDRRAALLALNAEGVGAGVVAPLRAETGGNVPFGQEDDPIRLSQIALESEADFVVVQLGDTARAEAARLQLTPTEYRSFRNAALRRADLFVSLLTAQLAAEDRKADVLLVSPRPPADPSFPNTWERPTPLLAFGPDFPPGLLISDTTRTPGLVSNVDLAPTLLRLFHAPIPATVVGRPIRAAPFVGTGPERVAAIAREDFVDVLNARTIVPFMIGLGVYGFLLVLFGMIARRGGGVAASRWFAPGLVFGLNLPAALLLGPLMVPPTRFEYALRILAWMVGLAVVCALLARPLRASPILLAAFVCLALVAGDTLTGQRLLKDSLFCGYALSGIRYYGIGNEYLGALLGFALVGGFAWLDERGVAFPPQNGRALRGALALFWLGLLLLLGWPGLGANAGSLAATGAGFGIGMVLLRGGKPTLRTGVLCVLGGLALAFVFSALDTALGGSVSHSGAAIRAATGPRGVSYLIEIAVRKVGMNFHLLLTPWLLLGAGVLALVFLLMRALIGDAIRELLRRRPWSAQGMKAVLAACLASLVFKDSGVVTVAFLLGGACVIWLYALFTVREQRG